MARKICSLVAVALAGGFVLTLLRLRTANDEIERLRAQLRLRGDGGAVADVRSGHEASAQTPGESVTGIQPASDLSSEWEQAVPPMDS